MLTRLFVLGLLSWKPMSGYEIQMYLHVSQTEQWAGVLPGSIYHALKKLAGEGFVVLQRTEQTGNRSKALYALTPAGKEEFRRVLREVWRTPILHFPSGAYAALNFLDELPREEVVAALDEQIARLERELAVWNAGEVAKTQNMSIPVPGFLTALFANGRSHIELDLTFLRYLRETLPSTPRLPQLPELPPLEEKNA